MEVTLRARYYLLLAGVGVLAVYAIVPAVAAELSAASN